MTLAKRLSTARLVSRRQLDDALDGYRELMQGGDSSASDMCALCLWWRGKKDEAIRSLVDVAPDRATRAAAEIMCRHLCESHLRDDANVSFQAGNWMRRLADFPEAPTTTEMISYLGWFARDISPDKSDGTLIQRVRQALDRFVHARRQSVLWARQWSRHGNSEQDTLQPPPL